MRRYIVVLAVGAVMTSGLAACGGDDASSTPGGSNAAGAPGTVTMSGTMFVPGEVTAGAGGLLTVINDDPTTHTFTMDDGSVDEEVAPGESVEVTVTTAGAFHCMIHPSMTGSVALP